MNPSRRHLRDGPARPRKAVIMMGLGELFGGETEGLLYGDEIADRARRPIVTQHVVKCGRLDLCFPGYRRKAPTFGGDSASKRFDIFLCRRHAAIDSRFFVNLSSRFRIFRECL
jgi:hypothetical protein